MTAYTRECIERIRRYHPSVVLTDLDNPEDSELTAWLINHPNIFKTHIVVTPVHAVVSLTSDRNSELVQRLVCKLDSLFPDPVVFLPYEELG